MKANSLPLSNNSIVEAINHLMRAVSEFFAADESHKTHYREQPTASETASNGVLIDKIVNDISEEDAIRITKNAVIDSGIIEFTEPILVYRETYLGREVWSVEFADLEGKTHIAAVDATTGTLIDITNDEVQL